MNTDGAIMDGKQQQLNISADNLARPEYVAGQYLTAQDLQSEQGYLWQRLRQHNRYLHRWGVVGGLGVVPANDSVRPWAVQVCPGLALNCCGDEIEVPAAVAVDIHDYLWQQPVDTIQAGALAYVGIRYAEELARPIPATPLMCGCDDPIYQPSRVQDGFQLDILWTLPFQGSILLEAVGERFDLCRHPIAPCPSCAGSPYVILASITLPSDEDEMINSTHINNWAHW
jgi:hypothetical protein